MSEPTPRKLASEIASLVQKYPGLGQDVFVHEADYNQAANSVIALKAELREVSNSLAHALKWKMELDSVRDTLSAQLSELTRISDALGTNEGHSSVDHILAMKAKIDAQRTKLLALADSIQEQGVRNAIREIVK